MSKPVLQNTTEYQRPPIVTIMGHVDHGKTSILDFIRKSNVQQKEYGGITQHVGAYQINHQGKKITFLDTPGHAAFTNMRSRGGRVSDIVILVVSAVEGVMPQTKEAINIIKASKVPMIVALNKVDLPDANIQKVKQALAENDVLVEDWGGDVVCLEVSAKTGHNINVLLDTILLIAELNGLKANINTELEAFIIEAKKDKRKGVLVNAIIKNGTLRTGSEIAASGMVAKVKTITNDLGQIITQAFPGDPVEILGFKDVPNVGDLVLDKGSELAELSIDETREEIIGPATRKTVGLVLKADTQGTLEAVKASLATMLTETVGLDFSIKFLSVGTGEITDSDVMLAHNVKGVVIGFNVKVANDSVDVAETYKVPVKTFKAIYELIDEVKALLEGSANKEEAKIKGRAEVLKTFKLPSGDLVAGCRILAGALKENSSICIYNKNPIDLSPEDTPIYVGAIKKLKHGKEDIKVAGKDTECGVLFKPDFIAIEKGMFIEVQR